MLGQSLTDQIGRVLHLQNRVSGCVMLVVWIRVDCGVSGPRLDGVCCGCALSEAADAADRSEDARDDTPEHNRHDLGNTRSSMRSH